MKESFRYITFHGTCENMKNVFYISINVKCDCSAYCKRPTLLYDINCLDHISKQIGKLLCRHKAMKLRLQKKTPCIKEPSKSIRHLQRLLVLVNDYHLHHCILRPPHVFGHCQFPALYLISTTFRDLPPLPSAGSRVMALSFTLNCLN